ncbi:MAG: N-acetyl-D-Glu racemase DgcA, partial [Myxococcota bacterium]
MRSLSARAESWPIAGTFAISRGSKTEARVVVAELREGSARGRGECVPYARYGETIEGVLELIEDLRTELERGLDRNGLAERLPAGAARNAVDCALWDLEAKRTGRRVWELAGVPEPGPLVTAYTISFDTPEAMAEAARSASDRPLLKLKLGGNTDRERVGAVRAAAPNARLVVDANEAWSLARLRELGPALAELGVELIEQPLPASEDSSLGQLSCPVPLCADESVHDSATLEPLRGRYDLINVKLDKTGGLTEALELAAAAQSKGMGIVVGCMVGTSLGMAPAT